MFHSIVLRLLQVRIAFQWDLEFSGLDNVTASRLENVNHYQNSTVNKKSFYDKIHRVLDLIDGSVVGLLVISYMRKKIERFVLCFFFIAVFFLFQYCRTMFTEQTF